jgi:hypothetical protein
VRESLVKMTIQVTNYKKNSPATCLT